MARLTWLHAPSPTSWAALRADINATRAWHIERSQDRVSELIAASSDAYRYEVQCFIDELSGTAPTTRFVMRTLEHLREYLMWLNWVGWRVARLAPLQKETVDTAARRLAQACLAYAGGRLVDDGIDAHLNFKQHRRTLVGVLIAEEGSMTLERACAESVFVGLLSYQRALRRLRESDEAHFAHAIERLFTKISHGVLAENHAPPVLEPHEYDAIVRHKAVAYNMILNRAALWHCEPPHRFALTRTLYEMDELAQLMNDAKDEEDDRSRSQVNAVGSRVVTRGQLQRVVRSGVDRIWQRTAALGAAARGVVAAMLEDLQLETLDATDRSPVRGTVLSRSRSSLDDVASAVRDGLWRLCTLQRPSGEFPTYHSPHADMAHPVYHESPFVTAFVLLALSRIVDARDTICDYGATYLQHWRGDDGYVQFLASGIRADLDDTALVNWALQSFGRTSHDYAALAHTLAASPHHRGLYLTWRDEPGQANDVDPCVTANVLRFVAPNGLDCAVAAAALGRALDDAEYHEGTKYYVSPVAMLYLASTVPGPVRAHIGDAADWCRRYEALLERWARGELATVNDASLLISTAVAVGVVDERIGPIVDQLLGAQESDGRWPAVAAFRAFDFWGSSALTTALAVEALHGVLTASGASVDLAHGSL